MKSFCFLPLVWHLLSCATTPLSAATPRCEHVVLKNDPDALSVARSYYPVIVHDQITAEEEEKLVLNLATMVEKYVRPRIWARSVDPRMAEIPAMLRTKKYRIQMVPLLTGGRRVVMLNLIHVEHGGDIWRKRLYSISDGGINQCRCFIDLAKNEILQMDCNGYG